MSNDRSKQEKEKGEKLHGGPVDTSKSENDAIRQKIGMENRVAGTSKAEFLDEIQTKVLKEFSSLLLTVISAAMP